MGSLLTFVNSVADDLRTSIPQVKIGTLSYWYSRRPPADDQTASQRADPAVQHRVLSDSSDQ